MKNTSKSVKKSVKKNYLPNNNNKLEFFFLLIGNWSSPKRGYAPFSFSN